MKNRRSEIARKIIPLIAIMGCMGGATTSLLEWSGTPNSYLITGLFVLIYALAGTALGMLAVSFFDKQGKDIVARNVKGELLLVKQPIYFAAGFAVIIAFITNMNAGTVVGLLAAIFYGFSFLLGLSNGILDYRESVTKNLLFAAIIPIGFSFVYGYYINDSDQTANMAWLFGSVYLFSYLLFINRMQLNNIIFFRKSVNIEDSKRIRVFNDWLIILFYMGYLVMFSFRKLLNVTYDSILAVIGWLMVVMEKITSWLLIDVPGDGASELPLEEEDIELLPDVRRPWLETLLKVMMYVVVGAVAIAAVISIIKIIVKIIKKIREKFQNNYNRSMAEKKIESKEYEEESAIVRDVENEDRKIGKRKKMQYNLKKLNEIPLAREKIRYVYGFVLERLYNKQVDIEQSDTPEEILKKIKSHRNGDKLAKMGFEDFTEKYRKARYSDKEIEIKENLAETGGKFEKGVSDIRVDIKSRFD
ncbi:MAG: hypothetical protein KAH14_08670 [Clostridiales bacterium]|nr:hypothetical protein [Clostridiales bacterium]